MKITIFNIKETISRKKNADLIYPNDNNEEIAQNI